MRKTQQQQQSASINNNNNKTSFKGILNIENEKLPQKKKTRSRSIRDRNNTTSNQYSTYSKTIQHQHSFIQKTGNNDNSNNRELSVNSNNNEIIDVSRQEECVSRIQKQHPNISTISQQQQNTSIRLQQNRSNNFSRNESSIQKIRQNMRKQSQQLKQKSKNRSNSRRKRSINNKSNKQNSIIGNHHHHANRFPQNVVVMKRGEQQQDQLQLSNQTHQLLTTKLTNMKNKLHTIQDTYSTIKDQLSSSSQLTTNNLLDNNNTSISSMIIMNDQQQLKQKANDLNNLLQSFHIKFKQTLNKTTKQLLNKIDLYQQQEERRKINYQGKENAFSNGKNIVQNNYGNNQVVQIDKLFKNIQQQFGIGQSSSNNNNQSTANSLFQKLNNDQRTNFNDLQKKIILIEQRLLKQ